MRVPDSHAIYSKTVGLDGQTLGYLKTTILSDGSVAHVKDKMEMSARYPGDGGREQVLRDLVKLRMPIEEVALRLKQFDWDSGIDLVTLKVVDVLNLLRQYVNEDLSALECCRWAEILEGRDDLGFQEGVEEELKKFVFQLASPELNGPITREMALRWQSVLPGLVD